MLISDFKKKFHQDLSDFYNKRSLGYLYKISLINICDIKEHEIILNNYFIKKSEISIFKKVIERLKKQEPIEYIFNNTCFLNNKIVLNNHVFIPRPETEELVDWILKEEKEKKNLKIVDVCTGSGCIALSLGKKTKHEIIAVEKSIHAVKIAKQNFEIHDLKIKCIHADIFNFDLDKDIDIIVSNPPYVPTDEKNFMSRNVLGYEPHLAIFVDKKNPLLFYERILFMAKNNINKKVIIYFEIHENLKNEMENLIISYKVKNYIFKKDFYNKFRMVKIQM